MSFDNSPDRVIEAYVAALGDIRQLDPQAEKEILQSIHEAESARRSAQTKLVEAHLLLVVELVRRHVDGEDETFQMIQDGNEGLLVAGKSYTGQDGLTFAEFATPFIERAILVGMAERRKHYH